MKEKLNFLCYYNKDFPQKMIPSLLSQTLICPVCGNTIPLSFVEDVVKQILLEVAKRYSLWLEKTRIRHKTWKGKSSTWKEDLPFVEKEFVQPFDKINGEVQV